MANGKCPLCEQPIACGLVAELVFRACQEPLFHALGQRLDELLEARAPHATRFCEDSRHLLQAMSLSRNHRNGVHRRVPNLYSYLVDSNVNFARASLIESAKFRAMQQSIPQREEHSVSHYDRIGQLIRVTS